MRQATALFGALVLAGTVAGCGSTGSAGGADTSKPLVVAYPTFDGESALSWMVKGTDMSMYSPLFDPLVVTDPKTQDLKPGLAESWDSSADGRTWTLHLRKGVPFDDPKYGDVTSADVAYQIERAKGKEAAGSDAPYWRNASTETPDPLTVVIKFANPTWELPYHLTANSGYINVQPKAYIEAAGDKKAAVEPIGTGPYKQVSYSPGVEHDYVAVSNHWRVHPDFKKMTVKAIADPSAQLNGVRAGEIDIALASGDMLEQAKSAGLHVKTVPDAGQEMLVLPGMARPGSPSYDPSLPWVGDDNNPDSAARALKVRQAMNLAINRQAIFKGLWNGAANTKTFNYEYYPWQAGFKESWTLPKYDPQLAKKLLAEAGYPQGFTLPVAATAMSSAPDGVDVTAAVVQDLERIGIKVNSTDMAYASLAPKFLDRTLDRAWLYGAFTRPEPSMLWAINSSMKGVAAILVERPQFEGQLDPIRAEMDTSRRTELTSALGQSLYDYEPAIAIGTKSLTWVLSSRVAEWPVLPAATATNLELVTAAK